MKRKHNALIKNTSRGLAVVRSNLNRLDWRRCIITVIGAAVAAATTTWALAQDYPLGSRHIEKSPPAVWGSIVVHQKEAPKNWWWARPTVKDSLLTLFFLPTAVTPAVRPSVCFCCSTFIKKRWSFFSFQQNFLSPFVKTSIISAAADVYTLWHLRRVEIHFFFSRAPLNNKRSNGTRV
jgi:hypothetical protein